MDELSFCIRILNSFFSQQKIAKVISMIDKNDFSGWEKWFQIELAYNLSTNSKIAAFNIEEKFSVRKNSSISQTKIRADVCLRPKGWKKNSWIFLELKQNHDYKKCIRAMIKDCDKMWAAKKRSINGIEVRYLCVVGVFKLVNGLKKKDVIDYIDKIDPEIITDGYFIKKLKFSDYYLLVF